jgi:hypothetical protein
MVSKQTSRTVYSARQSGCDWLMDGDCPGIILVLRDRLVLLLSMLSLSFNMLTLTLSLYFLLLSHVLSLPFSHLLFFNIAFSFSLALPIKTMGRLIIHGQGDGYIVG